METMLHVVTKAVLLPIFLFLALAGCDHCDCGIAEDGCEGIKDELTCRQHGCTPTCGVVFMGPTSGGYDCMARYNASLCVAVLPWSRHDHNNNADQQAVSPGEEVWACKSLLESGSIYQACIRFRNERDVPVGLVSYRYPYPLEWDQDDPCSRFDPDGTRFPWEGACGFHWFTRGLWEYIINR